MPEDQEDQARQTGPDESAESVATEQDGSTEPGLDQVSQDNPPKPPSAPPLADERVDQPVPAEADDAGEPELPDLSREAAENQSGKDTSPLSSIDLLKDVELNVKIELGRTQMLVEDVLRVAKGSVIEIDKLAGDPVDVYVNEQLVARGEVLVLNDSFCVRVNQIVDNQI